MNKSDEDKKLHRKMPPSVEMVLWLIVPVALVLRIYFFALYNYDAMRFIVSDYYWDLIIATLMVIFPVFFRQIFASFPLEYVLKSRSLSHQSIVNVGGDYFAPPSSTGNQAKADARTARILGGTELLFNYADSSRSLAKGIYGRSGVYLLLGVLVAFSGLVFFYTQTAALNVPSEVGNLLLLLAPKFGILFFIEFVAFFFLRQYRSAMDEFRYYESIARRREEVNALLILAADSEVKIDLMELLKSDSFFSRVSALEKDQSTEILEARKLEKGELELLEKVIDTVAKVKG